MPKLSTQEQAEFLATPGILMRIAVVDASGGPTVTPIWFLHQDGDILFTPRLKSAWYKRIQSDARVALCIDEDRLPYRKVLVEGEATLLHAPGEDDAWRSQYLAMAAKYVGDDGARQYVENTINEPRALLKVSLESAKVSTWRMPVEGEPQLGIWASRYYQPATRF
jgi:nitroimidazol reductase NimA-like FMN-containing flavoprotein (pyridoxamine 5'-phosphate oxidase superfamily)